MSNIAILKNWLGAIVVSLVSGTIIFGKIGFCSLLDLKRITKLVLEEIIPEVQDEITKGVIEKLRIKNSENTMKNFASQQEFWSHEIILKNKNPMSAESINSLHNQQTSATF